MQSLLKALSNIENAQFPKLPKIRTNFTAISLEIFRSFARLPRDVNYDKPITRTCITHIHAHVQLND